METSIGYANTIIPKVLYLVNGKSGIKWLEIGKKMHDHWGVIWAPAAINRFVKKLRGCLAMGKKRLSQQPGKGEGRGGIASSFNLRPEEAAPRVTAPGAVH
jgi:hypothetical protein